MSQKNILPYVAITSRRYKDELSGRWATSTRGLLPFWYSLRGLIPTNLYAYRKLATRVRLELTHHRSDYSGISNPLSYQLGLPRQILIFINNHSIKVIHIIFSYYKLNVYNFLFINKIFF